MPSDFKKRQDNHNINIVKRYALETNPYAHIVIHERGKQG